jgi:DNA-binding XRE family transcriptional regulator
MRLGKNIKMLRDQHDMTQDALAGRVHFSSGAVIAAIEAGEKTPSLWKAMDMAIQLGVSLSELVGEHARGSGTMVTNNANGDHQTVYQHVEGGILTEDLEAKLAGVVASALVQVLESQRQVLVVALTEAVRSVLLEVRSADGS